MSKASKLKAEQKKARALKRKKRRYITFASAAALIALAGAWLLLRPAEVLSSRSAQVAALKGYILGDAALAGRVEQTSPYVVFLSVCDGKDRARVASGTGATLEAAWVAADKAARRLVRNPGRDVVWAKADVVDSTDSIPILDLQEEIIEAHYRFFYRRGLAFDDAFRAAFLEAELNGNRIYRYYTEAEISDGAVDYNTPALNMNNLNNYLKATGREKMADVPERVTTFTTLGFFCGEDHQVLPLYDSGLDFGRRIVAMVDDKAVADLVSSSSRFLADQIGPDGKFLYGHFPIFDNPMNGYNTIRHICATWSLLNHYYRLTGDESVIPSVDAAIAYMLEEFVEYPAEGIAWVIERTADEVRLGANAMAVVMLTEYMDLLDTDEYTALVRLLANGIVSLQDPDSGKFYHVLNSADFSPKEEFRIIYYDGEATFALARAYSLTKEQAYLDAAVASVENFIRNDYTKYTDHWVAYSMNEVTKHVGEPRYYEFALSNVANNLNRIYRRETSFHTYLELLMAGWETYSRMTENEVAVNYPDNFDLERFAQTIYKRARHMLNGYFYPEYAMYMRYPDKILGSFFVRHHDYRVRIDDVQHFVGGYYNYIKYYDEIRPYLSEDFLSEIDVLSISAAERSEYAGPETDGEDFDD
ncbi:MAG: hypothetical protein FWG28_06450 [Clostridiales bacterium]|nr:hypothetical protein [Clostridiales bacterium]